MLACGIVFFFQRNFVARALFNSFPHAAIYNSAMENLSAKDNLKNSKQKKNK